MTLPANGKNSATNRFLAPHDGIYWVAVEKVKRPQPGKPVDAQLNAQLETEARLEYANNGLDPTQAVMAAIEQFLNVFPDTAPEEVRYSVMQLGEHGPFGGELAAQVDDATVREKVLHRCSCAHLPVHEYTAYIAVERNLFLAWMTTQARTATQAFANIEEALRSAGLFAVVEPVVSTTIFSGYHPPSKNFGAPVHQFRPCHLVHLQGLPITPEFGANNDDGFTLLSEEGHKVDVFDSHPTDVSVAADSLKVLLKGKLRPRNQDMNEALAVWECGWKHRVKCFEYPTS